MNNNTPTARLIALDYGSKRIGVAVSDETGKFALPHSVVVNDQNTLAEIKRIATEAGAKEFVMGESLNYAMKPNTIHAAASAFKQELESCGFTVHLEPEFMTSVQAERIQGKNEKSDASAAAIILQSYIDKRRRS